MKYSKLLIIFFILNLPIFQLKAQNEDEMQTLTGRINHSGGYGAVLFKSSNFMGKTMVLLGGRGVWTINRVFGIGFEGNGIVPINSYEGVDPDGLNTAFPVGGYGGLLLEPVVWSNKIVHITFPISSGAGWIGYVPDWENANYDPGRSDLYDQDVFWYFEPGASIEVNVTRFFRIDIGVTRRIVQNFELINSFAGDFNKNNFLLALKFGRF